MTISEFPTSTESTHLVAGLQPLSKVEMWHPEIEMLSRSEIHALQSEKLRRQVRYVYDNASFFRERWRAAGIRPQDIKSVDDLVKLPPFSKDDLRAERDRTGDPFAGTRCVPATQLLFVTHSSGTSGKPNLYGMTRDEYEEAGQIFARSSYAAGIRPGDHLAFPGGLRWHGTILCWDKAFEQMEVVKYYLGNSVQDIVKETLEMAPDVRDLNVPFVYQPETELEYIRTAGLNPKDLYPNLKLLWSAVDASPMRRKLLLETWGVPLRNQYGSGDQFWMSGECPHDTRYTHAPEDYFVFEVLDPITNEPVPAGGTGVLHITNLWSRSFPYIRYNMEDMVTYKTEQCSCGRTSMRLSIRGRFAWSVRIGEKYVFSQEVENVLWTHPQMAGVNYQLLRRKEQPQDRLIVRVTPNQETAPELREELEAALERAFEVSAEVVFVEAGAIGIKGIKMRRVVIE
ncbi:MAG: phenylacetate--CoA ligase family protein [Ktedonobacteraceae bacterium]|nr:phenylacetate--CoA ligase family protein [Ktedonobacteraceae bacterium]